MLLIKKLARKSFSKKIRNLFGLYPSLDVIDYTSQNISISDAFFWRTDSEFETIFKFTNILKYFYKTKDSNIKLIFFDKNNKYLKEINISLANNLNEIVIDKSFLNNIADYGSFYVFHETNDEINTIIRNSCYTGYSWKKNNPSMVHGNTITAQKKFKSKLIDYGVGGYSYFKKRLYKIQNHIVSEKTEIMLINPTKKEITIDVNDEIFKLKKGVSKLVSIDANSSIKIQSKCYLMRPIIFEHNDDYLNVYHG